MRPPLRPFAPHSFAEPDHTDPDWDLYVVFNGGAPIARVGRISLRLAKAVGASTTIVRVTKQYVQKMRFKHKDVLFQDITQLQAAFTSARVQRQGRKHLVFFFKSEVPGRGLLQAVAKATAEGHELFLISLHRVRGHKLKTALKKGILLRDGPLEV